MFCGKCGNELPDGAKFCGKCGNFLNNNNQIHEVNSQKINKGGNWLAKIDEKKMNSVFDWIVGFIGILILYIFRNWISLTWGLTTNKLVFFLHLGLFLSIFSFMEIPFYIFKFIYFKVGKKDDFKALLNIVHIVYDIIISVLSCLFLMNTKAEIIILIFSLIYAITLKTVESVKEKSEKNKGN